MRKGYRYDYYVVDVLLDAFMRSDGTVDVDGRTNCAIDTARESARLYCLPCQWTVCNLADLESDVPVRVRRKRNA